MGKCGGQTLRCLIDELYVSIRSEFIFSAFLKQNVYFLIINGYGDPT